MSSWSHSLRVIMRPHNMILAPVDDSGTVRELCSNTCLTSVNSKRNTMRCRMCSRLAFVSNKKKVNFCFKPLFDLIAQWFLTLKTCENFIFFVLCLQRLACSDMHILSCHPQCKVRQSLDGLMLRVCSDTCFINYHRVKNFPVFTCDICTSVFINKPLELKREDGGKTICSEECLVKVKEVWKSEVFIHGYFIRKMQPAVLRYVLVLKDVSILNCTSCIFLSFLWLYRTLRPLSCAPCAKHPIRCQTWLKI